MRPVRIAIAVLITLAGMEGQAPNPPGIPPLLAPIPGTGVNRNFAIPFGVGVQNGAYFYQRSSYPRAYSQSAGFNGLTPYYYWWNSAAQNNNVPTGPSYANPGTVRTVGELPPALEAPKVGAGSPEWTEARTSFTAASAKVSSARRSVEELKARLEALGQSPRPSITTSLTSAEMALQLAQERMTAGNLEESMKEIQRANYLANQVLKEFGR